MYRYQVDFTKVFVAGTLQGMTYLDYLRFADWASADAFCKRAGEVFTACVGNSAYRMECPILTAIESSGSNARIGNAFPNCPELGTTGDGHTVRVLADGTLAI